MLFALAAALLLALGTGVWSLLGGTFLAGLWRVYAFGGGLIWLLAAVFLLSGRLAQRGMPQWEARFPHIKFVWALVLTGTVLLLLACGAEYIAI